jgi:hypothetical protein
MDGLCAHYLKNPSTEDASRTCVGRFADRRTAGSVVTSNSDCTNAGHAGREIARSLIPVILATYIDAPTEVGGFGGSWATRGITKLPQVLDYTMDTIGQTFGDELMCTSTPNVFRHPGACRSAIHDYRDKSFMTSLYANGLIYALRLTSSYLSGAQIAAVKTMLRDILNYQWTFFDRTNECFPYPEGEFNSAICHPGFEEFYSTGEGCSPSPDSSGQHIDPYLFMYNLTGDVTYKTRAITILEGMASGPFYPAEISNPEWGANRLPKQATERYMSQRAHYYMGATPLATPVVPVCSVEPAITGTTTSGSVLTCGTGTWNNTPTAYVYQWYRTRTNAYTDVGGGAYKYSTTQEGGVDQKEANEPVGTDANTYTLVAGDVTFKMLCVVQASNASGYGVEAVTAKTAVIT